MNLDEILGDSSKKELSLLEITLLEKHDLLNILLRKMNFKRIIK